ncbi:MAG TPA: ATP-binding protein, partial [Gaiellaceae bacterium]
PPASGTSSSADTPGSAAKRAFRINLHVLWLPAVLLIAGLVVSYQAAVIHDHSQREHLRERTSAKLEPIRIDLSRNTSAAAYLTEGLASLITIEGEPSAGRFIALAADLLKSNNAIRNIAIAPNNVVSQVYPLEGNKAILGFRYADNAAQWPAVKRMMAEKQMVIAGPVSLVQGGTGIIIRRPIYVFDPATGGKTRYWGLVSTVIDFPKLIAQSHLPSGTDSPRIALRGAEGLGAKGAIFWGDKRVFDDKPVLSDITLPSGTWQLGGVPEKGWPGFNAFSSSYFQGGGLAALSLAGLLFGLLLARSGRQLEIVQRTQAETALRDSETRLLTAQEVAHLGFLDWNLETNTIAYSDEACRLYGFSRDDAPATPDLLIAKVVYPEDRALVRRRLTEAGQGLSKFELDHRVLRPDGTVLWITTHAELVRDADGKPVRLLSTAHDISERKSAEREKADTAEQLRRYAERLESLSQIDRLILSARSPEEVANATLARTRKLVGWPRVSILLIDRDAGELVMIASNSERESVLRPGFRTPLETLGEVDDLRRGEIRSYADVRDAEDWPVKQTLLDAGIRTLVFVPLIVEGELIGVLGLSSEFVAEPLSKESTEILRQVSTSLAVALQQARLHERLERHASELEERVAQRTTELGEANDELEAFAYSVAHDLRAPLRAMTGFSEALIEDYAAKLGDEGADYAQRIADAASSMDHLIEDLLAYSRLARAEIHVEPVSLQQALDEALSQQRGAIDTSQAELTVDKAFPEVEGNYRMLVQVLANLISNALKFVAPGETPSVRISAESSQERVRLSVEDKGIGIDPEHAQRIFRVFERLHGGEVYPGTGIGLAIVRKGVERMNGQVGVESKPGKGSRFWIELEAARESS